MSDATVPQCENEARAMLLQIAGRRTLPIPAELIVDHVLRLPGGWDWPIRRAALEAGIRRLASARVQEIAVVDGPRRGTWGRYRLGRASADGTLPYDVRLWSLSAIGGACDCPDFSRGGLGICKHLAAVVAHLAAKPRLFRRLLAGPSGAPSGIVWDAAVEAAAAGDLLGALRFARSSTDENGSGKASSPGSTLFRALNGGLPRLRATHASDPVKRLRLVKTLAQDVRRAGAGADPAARAVLAEEHDRLSRILRLHEKEAVLTKALGTTARRRRLYGYQKEGVRRFLSQGRLVLADDMGLGKTTQAIVAATALYDAGVVRRGLLVVPAALKPQWEREWRAISDGARSRRRRRGRRAARDSTSRTRRGFLVTNYEQVVRDLETPSSRWAPDLVVLDEAQRIKNWATKTALTVKRLKPDVSAGADRDADGEPARRAGLDRRVGRRSGARAQVAARSVAQRRRRRPARGRRRAQPRRPARAARARAAASARAPRCSDQLPARQDTTIPVDLTERPARARTTTLNAADRQAGVRSRSAAR